MLCWNEGAHRVGIPSDKNYYCWSVLFGNGVIGFVNMIQIITKEVLEPFEVRWRFVGILECLGVQATQYITGPR